jgi:hypothetical protein
LKRDHFILGLVAFAAAGPLVSIRADAQTSPPAIEVNGKPLDARGLAVLRRLEATLGTVPPGRYWYDAASGGAGSWGGPASAYVGPGLALGGPLPANASGGGHGRLTGVFINGRELHPLDVQGLSRLGPVIPGRYWWDASGNVGLEGGPVLFNFYTLVAQKQAADNAYYRAGTGGRSTYVGKGCAAVHGRLRSSEESSSYSYYVGC